MRRFKNILCIIEGELEETAALSRSMEFAARNGATLTVVYGLAGPATDARGEDLVLSESWDVMRRGWHEQLLELTTPARDQNVPVVVEVHENLDFVEIIRQVMTRGHDLLIKTPQSTEGIIRLLFGSTDLHLMRKCPCPVWIHQGDFDPGYRRILAAVDVLPQSEEEALLNRFIMDLATSMAAIDGSEVNAVHGWSLYGESALRGRAFLRSAEHKVDDMLRSEMRKRRDAFDRLLEPYRRDGHLIEEHLIKGDARLVIPEFARDHAVDLIVMGTVARTGLSGFLIGNTAEDIIRQVECSVLAVKPAGFVSPIAPDEDHDQAA